MFGCYAFSVIIGKGIIANDLRLQSRCDGNSTYFRDKDSKTLNAGLLANYLCSKFLYQVGQLIIMGATAANQNP